MLHTCLQCIYIYTVGLEWNMSPHHEAMPGLTPCPAAPTLRGERVLGNAGAACGGTRSTGPHHRPRAPGHVLPALPGAAVPHPGPRPAPSRLRPHSLPMAVAARPRSQRCHRRCRRRHVTRAADGPSLPARGDAAVPPSRSAPRAFPRRGELNRRDRRDRRPPRRGQAEGGQAPRPSTALPECSARPRGGHGPAPPRLSAARRGQPPPLRARSACGVWRYSPSR